MMRFNEATNVEVKSNMEFNWIEMEENNVFVTGTDLDFTNMFNAISAGLADVSTLEITFDLKEELKPMRECKNVIEYSLAGKQIEQMFFEQFGLRNQVIEGRYITIRATKGLIKELIEKYADYPQTSKKSRIAMKALQF